MLFAPFYLAIHGLKPMDAPLSSILFQAFYQGVLATAVSLYLFAKAITLLGASAGAAFGAFVPVMAALLAIPILGEWPSGLDWLGIISATIGVYLASGGPLPARR
ncbi:EamA family transporter [Xanthobacter sp. KR7-65]|uniref:EamA family transporter n=1 Tax=Xanthobacter sp. KR7-65 TaxID=3156612 RepID=UPI0032B3434E